jgi:hypothetical protein
MRQRLFAILLQKPFSRGGTLVDPKLNATRR